MNNEACFFGFSALHSISKTVNMKTGLDLLLIGCGDIASSFYAPVLKHLQQKRLVDSVFIDDIDKQKAEEFSHRHGFTCGFCPDTADAVIVTTPYLATKEVVISLSRYGKPILMEKPPATTVKDALEMISALERHQVVHQVAFNRHHMPMTKRLLEEMGSRVPTSVHTEMHRFRRKEDTFWSTAIHDIELVSFITRAGFSSAEIIYSRKNTSFEIIYELSNGAFGSSIFLTNSGMVRETVEAICQDWCFKSSLPMYETVDENGCFESFSGNRLVSSGKGSTEEAWVENGILAQLESFVTCVMEGRKPEESLESALGSIAIMEAVKDGKRSVRL